MEINHIVIMIMRKKKKVNEILLKSIWIKKVEEYFK